MRTVTPDWAGAPVASITVTFVMARSAVSVLVHDVNNIKVIMLKIMIFNFIIVPLLSSVWSANRPRSRQKDFQQQLSKPYESC